MLHSNLYILIACKININYIKVDLLTKVLSKVLLSVFRHFISSVRNCIIESVHMSQTQNGNLFRKPKQGLWELKYLFRLHQNIRNALELKRRRNDRVEPWEFFSGKFTAPGFMDTVNFRKIKYFQIILSNQNLCNLLSCYFTRLEAEFLKLISVFLEVKVKRFDGWASSPCRVVCSSVLEKGFWSFFRKLPT